MKRKRVGTFSLVVNLVLGSILGGWWFKSVGEQKMVMVTKGSGWGYV